MRHFTDLLDSGLVHRARLLEQMTVILRSCLPKACVEHVWAGGIVHGQLVVLTDSGSWRLAIHQYQTEVLRAINQTLSAELPGPLTGLKVKVGQQQADLDPNSSAHKQASPWLRSVKRRSPD